MLSTDEFNKMITGYCSNPRLKDIELWDVYVPSCSLEFEECVVYSIWAQDKKYLKVQNHQIELDFNNSIHKFVIVELTSNVIVRMMQQHYLDLTEIDIEEIKLGLDNSYCEMCYYIIEYYFYEDFWNMDSDYEHDEALFMDDSWVNDRDFIHWYKKNYIIFSDREEAIDWIHMYYLKDDWVVEKDT